jgi:acetyl esterase/lipase
LVDVTVTLHPQAVAYLERINKEGNQPLSGLTAEQARELDSRLTSLFAGPGEPVSSVRDMQGGGSGTEIPIRVYNPDKDGEHPILIYFHGGGWVLGDLDGVDSICRMLTNRLHCVVASVGYRLAPEHKFPEPGNDCYAATCWIAANAAKIGGDPGRLAVGGDSAGGNLAAVVSLMARDRKGPKIGFQVLVYPATDLTALGLRSEQESPGLTKEDMIWLVKHYLRKPSDARDPYASPLRAGVLEGLPPAHIVTAEYDVLTKQCEDYAVRLIESGVHVKTHHFNGHLHGFFTLPQTFDASATAVDAIAKGFAQTLG